MPKERVDIEKLLKLQDGLENKVYEQECSTHHQFRRMMRFVREKALPEKYTFDELQSFAAQIMETQLEDQQADVPVEARERKLTKQRVQHVYLVEHIVACRRNKALAKLSNDLSLIEILGRREEQSYQESEIKVFSQGIPLKEKIQDLGKGGFGFVEEVVDLQSLEIYAAKRFTADSEAHRAAEAQHHFRKEFNIYRTLQYMIPSDVLHRYVLALRQVDNRERVLYFEPGLCTLEELYS